MLSLPEAVTPSFQYYSRIAGPPYPRPSGRMPPGATGWDHATGRWEYPRDEAGRDRHPRDEAGRFVREAPVTPNEDELPLAPLAPEADEPPKEMDWVGLGLFFTAVGVSAGLVC